MRFLNPKTDFAFKRIFGAEGSEGESRDILLSFLNGLFGLVSSRPLASAALLDPRVVPKIAGLKDNYPDMQVRDDEGRNYVVAFQILTFPCPEQRLLHKVCREHAEQIGRGEEYHLLTDVIAITITDFVMFEEQAELVSRFKLRAEQGQVYGDDLELLFVELPKFQLQEEELATTLDRWLYFLKHAADLTAVPGSLAVEPAIGHAFAIANKAGLTPEELDDQERREIYIQDQRGALQLAERRGIETGKEIGVERGRREERLTMARNLLPLLDDEAIAAVTGLEREAIARLRQG